MSTEVTTHELSHETLSALVIGGDLSRLSVPQKMEYYTAFCRRIGLDPATQPFKILKLQGKETLYAGRECAAQLCKLHGVSHNIVSRSREDDLSVVIAKASTPDGRCTESMGAVSILGLKGEALANALMKTETKAKRRATLDLLGLGLLDETEIETIPGAVSTPLTTEVTVTESKPLPQVTDADMTTARAWRAKVNKKGSECKTREDIDAAIAGFEKLLGTYFDGPTYHKQDETFRTLLMSHSERVDNQGPEAVKAWLTHLGAVSQGKDLAGFVTAFTTSEWLKTTECEDALAAKAVECGFENLDAAIEALVRKV